MSDNKNILHEPMPDFEKAETDQLKNALKRSYIERFKIMTSLMKMNSMFRQAKITRKPLISSK